MRGREAQGARRRPEDQPLAFDREGVAEHRRDPEGFGGRRRRFLRQVGTRSTAALALAFTAAAGAAPAQDAPEVRLFFQAAVPDEKASQAALDRIAEAWRDGYAGMIVDLARLMRSPRRLGAFETEDEREAPDDLEGGRGAAGSRPGFGAPARPAAPPDPSSIVRTRLLRFLERQTGQRHGDDLRAWRRWLWSRPYEPHPDLAFFKSALYSTIDPRIGSFFAPGTRAEIRLDEVDWGGVKANGIPPLDHPRTLPGREADYLKDKNVVFGIVVNGEARAYPKRILAWHEMALDRLGGVELAIVYCTLCGTVIPYGAEVGGEHRTFGTSGLLYRSNKLMFDHESLSLWSTVEGKPVIGPLAGQALELKAYPVVTTTWREWLAAHPDSSVLSLDTGFERDYSEGAAYRDYFATDQLMFEVPRTDKRLKNKAEVLTLLLRPADSPASAERKALALSADFLKKNPLHALSFAGHALTVVTSPDGANRVYASGANRLLRLRLDGRVEDARGGLWRVAEDALHPEAGDAEPLPRVAARRAFWFGWFAQFPDGELVK